MKIGSIVVDCFEFDRIVEVWQEALHYIAREPSGRHLGCSSRSYSKRTEHIFAASTGTPIR